MEFRAARNRRIADAAKKSKAAVELMGQLMLRTLAGRQEGLQQRRPHIDASTALICVRLVRMHDYGYA